MRYKQDFDAGKVGKTVYSRSGKNLPVGRPKRIFNRYRVTELRRNGASIRQIAKQLGVGVGTITRTLAKRLSHEAGRQDAAAPTAGAGLG
jgi:putative DNA-invertase from lambdoid prophage Rac